MNRTGLKKMLTMMAVWGCRGVLPRKVMPVGDGTSRPTIAAAVAVAAAAAVAAVAVLVGAVTCGSCFSECGRGCRHRANRCGCGYDSGCSSC